MLTLDGLRNGMSAVQIRLLTLIWEHYLSKGKWIHRQVVHHAFRPNGRALVRDAMQTLGGTVVYEGWEGGEDYRVTLLGVVLSEHGRVVEDLLVKYLSFARDAFEANPEHDHLSRDDIQTAFSLSDDEAYLLGKLIFFDYFLGVGGAGGKEWRTQFPPDVEDIPDDAQAYLQAKLLSRYNAKVPTASPDREREIFGAASTLELSDAPPEAAAGAADRMRTPFDGFDIHPRIAAACVNLYRDGYYADAVLRAFLALERFVQEKSGRQDLNGSALMEQAFSPNGPALAFNALADQSDRDERRGMMLLFQGSVFAFRNPRAHKSPDDLPERALGAIVFFSFLARRLEEAQSLNKA